MSIKTSLFRTFAILLLIFITNSNSYSNTIKNGEIDLSEMDWNDSPYIKLEGDWDFYWKKFVDPKNINDSALAVEKLSAPLPGPWTKIQLNETEKCPAQGYGTYHLKAKLPNKDQVYALKMLSVFSAYKIFINNKLAYQVGEISKNKEQSVPAFKTKEIPFEISKKGQEKYQTTDIVIQVSNFHHRRAGLQKPIHIGTIDKVTQQTQKEIIISIFLVGIILIIGFNHVLMYALRRLDIGNLIFGLLATVMILRNLTTGERLMQLWLPNMSWETLVRLDNFSGFATIAFFAFYFFFSFRKDFPKIIFYIIMSIGAIITVLVFGSKAWFYGQFRLIFEAYIGLGGFYLVFGVLLVAAIRKRSGAFITFIGMFLLYGTAVNDVLISMGVLKTGFVASYGIAAFMIIQSFLLTRKSAKALKSNLSLSNELNNEKLKLEERINERTQELSKQAQELESHKENQEKQSWVNESLNQLNDIMKTNKDNLNTLADSLLACVVKKIDASLGALYFLNETKGDKSLILLAHYGLNQKNLSEKIDTKEGLVGKCFNTKKTEHLTDLPEGFLEVNSGLGKATPSNVLLYPMIVDEKAIGVIELATFKDPDESRKEFIEKGVSNIAAQLNIIKMNDETKLLLNTYKEYESELKQKDKEYLQMKEELEELRERVSD